MAERWKRFRRPNDDPSSGYPFQEERPTRLVAFGIWHVNPKQARAALHLFFVSCFAIGSPALAQQNPIADQANETMLLKKEDQAPHVNIVGLDGTEVALSSLYADRPLIVAFFRGGWCPFCTRHTQELIKAYPELKEKEFDLIAISPDSVESSKANVEKNAVLFSIYSDVDLNASRGFGIAFHVDDATVAKYEQFGIDLEAASGRNHHGLPVPAVYVIDQQGAILFAHSNPDYRQRLSIEDLFKGIGIE